TGAAHVADLAGNPLDGDGDTTGGDDFERGFREDLGNRYVNGNLDCVQTPWQATPAAAASQIPSVDFEDSSDSGSLHLQNPTGNHSLTVGQCVPVSSAERLALSSRLRLDGPPTLIIGAFEHCTFYDAAGCTGTSLGTADSTLVAQPTGGGFTTLASTIVSPVG